MLKLLNLGVLISLSTAWTQTSHERDPKVSALPYTLYGEESVELKGNCKTARRGWVGSGAELTFGNSGGSPCEIYGDIVSIGTLDASGTQFYSPIFQDGNASLSNAVFWDSTEVSQADSKDGWATYTPDSLLEITDVTNALPELHTTNFYPDGTHVTEAADDCNYAGSGWQCGGANYGDTLPPGTYGTLSVSDSAFLAAGEYYIDDLNLASDGGITVAKEYSEVTRMIVRRGMDTNPRSYLVAEKKNDFGKVMIYLDGANSAGATFAPNSRIDATVYAPFSDVSLNPSVTFNGQIIAKNISAQQGYNGLLGRFIPFQAPQIRFGSDLTLEEEGGTRVVTIPVELNKVAEAPAQLSYEVIYGSDANSAVKGKDIHGSILLGGSGNVGVIKFDAGSQYPSKELKVYLYDDDFKENTEYFEVRLYDAVGALFWSNVDDITETISIIDNDTDGDPDPEDPDPTDPTDPDPTEPDPTDPTDPTDPNENVLDTTTTVVSDDSTWVEVDTTDANVVEGIIYTNQPEVDVTLEDGTQVTLDVNDIVDDSITFYDPSIDDSSRVAVVYDTIAPVIEILNPGDSATLSTKETEITWTIDGVTQDSLNREELDEGEYLIIREAYDRAGNYGVDTIVVFVIIPQIETSNELVTDLITKQDAQSKEDIETIKGREVSEDEIWSFSFLDQTQSDKNNQVYTEVMVGVRENSGTFADDEVQVFDSPNSYDPSDIKSPQIAINLTLPLSRDITGAPGTGVCEETGQPRWDHYIENLMISQYDNLGQFANKFYIEGPIKIEGVEQFQDDKGRLSAIFELPVFDGVMKSFDQRQLGSGVYILQTFTRIRSVPNSDCNKDDILIDISTSLHNMGYMHP